MSQQIPVKDISPDPVKVYEPQYVDLYAKREKFTPAPFLAFSKYPCYHPLSHHGCFLFIAMA